MGSPRQRGLKASGLQRRQSGGETHEHQTNASDTVTPQAEDTTCKITINTYQRMK